MNDAATRREPTRWFGLRFAAPETERAYRDWHQAMTITFARVGYIGSAPSWSLLLLAVVVLDADAAARASLWIGAWILALVVLTGLTLPTALRPTVVPLAALANCTAGFLIVWLLSDVVLASRATEARAGIMTAGLLVVMFFGFAIHRLTPGLAVSAVTPYLGFGLFQLWDDHRVGDLGQVEAASLGAAQCIAYLGCLLVCVVTELVDRRAFCREQVIAAQRRELHATRGLIRRYVPRAVSERIEGGDVAAVDQPRRLEVTVLLADLVAFTDLAESVDADLLTRVTNEYITAVTEVVEEYGGLVCEFAGDGTMAVFGAPEERDPHEQAVLAVGAAMALQERMPVLSSGWREAGAPQDMLLRIGISTGVLSVGSFGSAGRTTYTAMGSHTNIASRLESHCRPGGVLVSATTWQLARDTVDFAAEGVVRCKGVAEPVAVFSPKALSKEQGQRSA